VPGKLFLVVADTTNLVTGLRVKGGLLERLVCARARPPVGGHLYRSLRGILHDCFTERSTVLAFNVSQLFALKHRLCGYDAVRMAHQRATLSPLPTALIEALDDALALKPADDSQRIAQPEMVKVLHTALDARRQRIVISESDVGAVKWVGILLQGLCTLVAIAMVHSDNRRACAITLMLFATGVALSVLLIAAYSRPFHAGGVFCSRRIAETSYRKRSQGRHQALGPTREARHPAIAHFALMHSPVRVAVRIRSSRAWALIESRSRKRAMKAGS
jgi:hypothetical protein